MTHEIQATASEAVRAQRVELARDLSIEEVAATVFENALDHFVINAAAFMAGEKAETIHQMRVALRRLRAAIGLFRPVLSGPALSASGLRAKEIAAILGVARDQDVFIDLIEDGPLTAFESTPEAERLRAAALRRRTEGYAAVHRMIADGVVDDFEVRFRQIINNREWIAAPGASIEAPARIFAAKALTRARRRVLRRSEALAAQTPGSRHAVRIALKKARYAAEFFESLFGRRKAMRTYCEALGALQDSLGAFNDLATADRLLDRLDADDPTFARVSGFVRGWFAHATRQNESHMHRAERRLKALAPFWD